MRTVCSQRWGGWSLSRLHWVTAEPWTDRTETNNRTPIHSHRQGTVTINLPWVCLGRGGRNNRSNKEHFISFLKL